jgi:hypothetical protein
MQGETAETAYFDTFAGSQGLTHLFDDVLDCQLDVAKRKMGLAPS